MLDLAIIVDIFNTDIVINYFRKFGLKGTFNITSCLNCNKGYFND